jgi:hypothetical protein
MIFEISKLQHEVVFGIPNVSLLRSVLGHGKPKRIVICKDEFYRISGLAEVCEGGVFDGIPIEVMK